LTKPVIHAKREGEMPTSRHAAPLAAIVALLAAEPVAAQPEGAGSAATQKTAASSGARPSPPRSAPAEPEPAPRVKGAKAGKNPKPAPRAAKASSPPASTRGRKPKPPARLPGSKPGVPDDQARRQVTGRHPDHSTAEPLESPELRAMRELDRELFPPAAAPPSAPWPSALKLPDDGPVVDASGLPSSAPPSKGAKPTTSADLAWLASLKKPDFPVRFEPAVVRYLEFYKSTERGRGMIAAFVRKSGRYREVITKLLREQKLPEDLLWLALVESAFDASIHSHAGAAGLWQFMPATGRIYGLTVNKRVDERLDPERSTHAALKHLKDLYQRFGTWELAFAAYNMGYGGLLAAVRRFNSNDYWELSRIEAGLPYETALYVPKIMAMAIAARNCQVFGCDAVKLDAALPFGDVKADKVSVAPGVTLDEVATATGVERAVVATLNPQVIGSRLPPIEQSTLPRKSWTVYVPEGKGQSVSKDLPRVAGQRKLGTHRVRWGETLAHIALAYDSALTTLERLNDLEPSESPRPGTTVFVPSGRNAKTLTELAKGGAFAPAVVPRQDFRYRDRRRVFYEAVFGDTVEDVARHCSVSPREVRRWNHLDARAALQEGMRLQLFIPKHARPQDVLLLEEEHVRVVRVESPQFFDHVLGADGRERIQVTVRDGDTWKSLSERYGLSQGMLERINHKSRRSKLEPGEKLIVYARRAGSPAPGPSAPPARAVTAPGGSPSERSERSERSEDGSALADKEPDREAGEEADEPSDPPAGEQAEEDEPRAEAPDTSTREKR
jgi:membrane-bound lytic murein transglycosylase D